MKPEQKEGRFDAWIGAKDQERRTRHERTEPPLLAEALLRIGLAPQ